MEANKNNNIEIYKTDLAKCILRYRGELDVSQEDLAGRMEVSQKRIARIERSETMTEAWVVQKLIELKLGKSLYEVLFGEEECK